MAQPLKTYVGLDYETDFSTDLGLRMISGLDSTEEYTARADQLISRVTGLYSESVAWIEIDDTGRKSVVQVRVLTCQRGRQGFWYPWLGITRATNQRMNSGLCPTTPPMILPPEFRPANQ
eukprot:5739387-Pleurochrysis_carterae.AAC.1